MNRIDNSSGNDVITRLATIRQQLDAMSAIQHTDARNVTGYAIVSTTSTYTLAPGAQAGLYVIFLSDHQDYPFAVLSYQIFIGSTSSPVLPGDTGYPSIRIYEQRAKKGQSNSAVTIQSNELSTGPTYSYLIQFTVQATDTGRITL